MNPAARRSDLQRERDCEPGGIPARARLCWMASHHMPDQSEETAMSRLMIVGGLVLLVLVGIGSLAGIAYLVHLVGATRPAPDTAIHEAQTVVLNFFDDLSSSGAGEAYQRTSKGFRSKQSLEQFEVWVSRNPQVAQAGEKA